MIKVADVVNPRVEKVQPKDCPDLPFIGLDDIEAHTMRLLGTKPASDLKSSAKRFYSGDVLYSRLRPYLNKVWCANFQGICSSEFIVLPGNNHINPQFLTLRFNAIDFVTFANSLNTGDRPRVDFDQISSFFLPPFSLEQQHRIVDKIEELFSDLEDGIASLKKAQQQLKVYRQAVLKWAFEGKFTAQWREEQKRQGKLESADTLLEQIKAEREQRYQAELAAWQADVEAWEANGKVGKKPGKPKLIEKLRELTNSDINTLPVLPKDWFYIRAENISDFITKGTTPQKGDLFERKGDVPFIKVYNLTHRGSLDFSVAPTFVSKETHNGFLARSKVLHGDVLMNIVGPPLGKVSLVPNTFDEWNINQAIVRYRTFACFFNKYLTYFLLSQGTIDRMSGRSKATAGQFNLTLEICRDIQIPFLLLH